MPFRIKVGLPSAKLDRLRKTLEALDRTAATRAMRAGMNEVTKAVLADARALAPVRTSQLRRALGRRVRSYRRGRVVVGVVGPRVNFRVVLGGVPVDPANYAHLAEFGRGPVTAGTRTRVRRGRTTTTATGRRVLSSFRTAAPPDVPRVFGRSVRAAPGRLFLTRAWARNRRRARLVFVRHLREAIRRLVTPLMAAGGGSRWPGP